MSNTPAPPTVSQRLRTWAPWVCVSVLFAGFIGLTVSYVRSERFFYFWDNFAYHRAALESLSVFQLPGTSWTQHLRASMQSGFSELFTVPMAPLMDWLGGGRVVFIAGIVGFYLLPCAFLCTLVVHRLLPLARWQWPLVFLACATFPVLWRASLAGYPDIGGIMIGLGAILLITGDRGFRKWSTALILGVLLALTFLFRRHLVYLIIPLMGATSVFALVDGRRAGNARRGLQMAGTLARLAVTTLLTVGIIWAVAPRYFRELVSTNFRELYLPFQFPILDVWRQHRDYIGIVYWLLGLAGWIWALAPRGAARWMGGLLLVYLAGSIGIWVFYLRYMSVQYNLHFAVIVAIGVGLLMNLLSRNLTRPALPLLLAAGLALLWLDRLAFVRLPLPAAAESVLPFKLPPLVNPNYAEIKKLITFLRAHCTPPHNHVLVVASSQVINSDMLAVGEGALWGRDHRQMDIMNGSHADTVQPYPLRDMIAADWLVVALPFQHHLRVEDQGVVLAPYQAMTEPSRYREDFRPLEPTFALEGGITLAVYQRTAVTAFPTQVEAARRIFDTVGTTDAWTGPFMPGEARTGAEYFDARLIVPSSPGEYTVDFSQVRLRDGQRSVIVFARLAGGPAQRVSGHLADSGGEAVEIDSSFFPDDRLDMALPASAPQVVGSGTDFKVAVSSPEKGVLALEFNPRKIPSSGSPLGLVVRKLKVEPRRE